MTSYYLDDGTGVVGSLCGGLTARSPRRSHRKVHQGQTEGGRGGREKRIMMVEDDNNNNG